MNEEIKIEREKSIVIENKDGLIDEICTTVRQLVYFEEFDESITKEVLDKIIIHSKSDIEVYLKGFSREHIFFADGSKTLDNHYRCL